MDNGPTYEYMCPEGYTGVHCEENVNDCQPGVCPPAATCVDLTGDFYCRCPFNLTGEDCRKTIQIDYDLHFIDEAKTSSASTPGTADNEDEEGWETVRPRARSKYSPVSESSSRGRPPRVRHSHKTRFQMPSSAISLPTLSLMKEEEGDGGGAAASKVCDKSKSKDEEVKTKTDAVKEESHSGDMTPKAEEETKTRKTEAEEEEGDLKAL